MHTIKRVIDRDRGSEHGRGAGASTYFVNGNKSNLKSVKELVTEKYHIHIDNLCTFLPQDKVGNFSGFDKQSLLAETEKSLSGHLYDTHQELIKLESEVRHSGCDVQTVQDKLQALETDNRRLERDKELMEERQSCIERIDLLKKKRAWLVFDTKREQAIVLKNTRESLKKQKKEAQQKLKPIEQKHAHVEGEVSKIQSRFASLESKVKKDRKTYEDCFKKAENHQDAIENELADYQSIDAAQRRAEREVEKQRARLEEVEAEAADFPPMEEVEKTLHNAQNELRATKKKLDGAKKHVATIMDKIEREEGKKQHDAHELNRLKDEKTIRRNNLFGKFKNLKEAYQWIDQNRKMFRRPIHGPVGKDLLLSFL